MRRVEHLGGSLHQGSARRVDSMQGLPPAHGSAQEPVLCSEPAVAKS